MHIPQPSDVDWSGGVSTDGSLSHAIDDANESHDAHDGGYAFDEMVFSGGAWRSVTLKDLEDGMNTHTHTHIILYIYIYIVRCINSVFLKCLMHSASMHKQSFVYVCLLQAEYQVVFMKS